MLRNGGRHRRLCISGSSGGRVTSLGGGGTAAATLADCDSCGHGCRREATGYSYFLIPSRVVESYSGLQPFHNTPFIQGRNSAVVLEVFAVVGDGDERLEPARSLTMLAHEGAALEKGSLVDGAVGHAWCCCCCCRVQPASSTHLLSLCGGRWGGLVPRWG